MPRSLIKEAARRGRAEADRRALQQRMNEAYHAEIDKVEDRHRRQRERAEARQRTSQNIAQAGRTLFFSSVHIGWLALCFWWGYDQSWQGIAALDGFFWDKTWLAYVGLIILYGVGHRLFNDLMGVRRTS